MPPLVRRETRYLRFLLKYHGLSKITEAIIGAGFLLYIIFLIIENGGNKELYILSGLNTFILITSLAILYISILFEYEKYFMIKLELGIFITDVAISVSLFPLIASKGKEVLKIENVNATNHLREFITGLHVGNEPYLMISTAVSCLIQLALISVLMSRGDAPIQRSNRNEADSESGSGLSAHSVDSSGAESEGNSDQEQNIEIENEAAVEAVQALNPNPPGEPHFLNYALNLSFIHEGRLHEENTRELCVASHPPTSMQQMTESPARSRRSQETPSDSAENLATNSRNSSEINLEGSGCETSSRISGEVRSGMSGEVTSGISGDFTSGVSGEIAPGSSGEIAPGSSGEIAPGSSGEIDPELSGEITSGLSGEITSGISVEISSITSEEVKLHGSETNEPVSAEAKSIGSNENFSDGASPSKSSPEETESKISLELQQGSSIGSAEDPDNYSETISECTSCGTPPPPVIVGYILKTPEKFS